jgi:hypothetical protein
MNGATPDMNLKDKLPPALMSTTKVGGERADYATKNGHNYCAAIARLECMGKNRTMLEFD